MQKKYDFYSLNIKVVKDFLSTKGKKLQTKYFIDFDILLKKLCPK